MIFHEMEIGEDRVLLTDDGITIYPGAKLSEDAPISPLSMPTMLSATVEIWLGDYQDILSFLRSLQTSDATYLLAVREAAYAGDLSDYPGADLYLCRENELIAHIDRRLLFLSALSNASNNQRSISQVKSGYVYLVRSLTNPQYFKIGRSGNVDERMRLFGIQLPFEIELEHTIPCVDCVKAEKELHNRFEHKRVNGEWFSLNTDDIKAIKDIERID